MTDAAPHVIRKYANRKLYDTTTSRYVTLSGVWQLVCTGHDVRVVEHETGNDITALVLSQIVASHEKVTAIVTTPEAARDAAERRDTLLDYLRRTLSKPASMVGDEVGRRGSEFAAAVQDSLKGGSGLADEMSRRSSELAAGLNRRRSEMEEAVETAVDRALSSFNFSSRRDLTQLRRRVEELEKRVAGVQEALQADLQRRGSSPAAHRD